MRELNPDRNLSRRHDSPENLNSVEWSCQWYEKKNTVVIASGLAALRK